MSTVTCPSCGATVTLPAGRKSIFCGNCGTQVSAVSTQSSSTPSDAVLFDLPGSQPAAQSNSGDNTANGSDAEHGVSYIAPQPNAAQSGQYPPNNDVSNSSAAQPNTAQTNLYGVAQPNSYDTEQTNTAQPNQYGGVQYDSYIALQPNAAQSGQYPPNNDTNNSGAAQTNPYIAPQPNVTQPNPYGVPQPNVAGIPTAPNFELPPKKTGIGKLVAIVGGIVLVVAVAAVITGIYAFAGNSYQKVETAFFAQMLSSAEFEKGYKLDFNAGFTIDKNGYLYNELDIDEISVNGSLSMLNSEMVTDTSVSVDSYGAMRAVMSATTDGANFQFPDITDYYFRTLLTEDEDAILDVSKLDQKRLAATFANILKIYFAEIEPLAVIEKDVELSGGSVTVKCDKYTIEFTTYALSQVILKSIDEIRANRNFIDFVDEYIETSGMYFDYADFEDALDEAYADIEEYLDDYDEDEEEILFRMQVWAAGDKVLSRKIDKISDEGKTAFSYQTLIKDNYANFEAKYVDYYGDTMLALSGDFEKVNGGWNGTLNIKSDGTSVAKVKCENIQRSGSKSSGTLSTSIPEFGRLTLTYAVDSASAVVIPKLDEGYAVIIGDYSEENVNRANVMLEELDDFDIDNIMDTVIIDGLTGILEEITWNAEYYGSGSYGGFFDDDDYYDFDDDDYYDFDDDYYDDYDFDDYFDGDDYLDDFFDEYDDNE